MGKLTTHVLDTAAGIPGAHMGYALYRLVEGQAPMLVVSGATNRDGRTDQPLLEGETMVVGRYELVFSAGDYFRNFGWALTDPPFLDQIPLCFGIHNTAQHYHVPLLVSPYSYSTYRGS